MPQEPDAPQPDTRLRFLRVVGTIWLVVMALTLGGAALAPYLGHIADIVLQQTVHRQWARLALDAEQPFFDLSTPTRVVQSYYSALYQGNVTNMERLTHGPLREQMRLRTAATTTTPAFTHYRSFLRTEMQGEGTSVGDKIRASLQQTFTEDNPRILQEQKIGPKVGAELRRNAFLAVISSLVAMGLYVAFRFKFIYGVGAIIALFHDVMVALGAVSILDGITQYTNFEIDQNMIAAFLTIIGLSMNDTVVIFDRIRENQKVYRSMGLMELINKSLNETLSRTIITSGTVFVITTILFFLGGEVNRGFAFALTIGILTGTYSSIYIASAIVLDYTNYKERKKQKPIVPEKISYEAVNQGS